MKHGLSGRIYQFQNQKLGLLDILIQTKNNELLKRVNTKRFHSRIMLSKPLLTKADIEKFVNESLRLTHRGCPISERLGEASYYCYNDDEPDTAVLANIIANPEYAYIDGESCGLGRDMLQAMRMDAVGFGCTGIEGEWLAESGRFYQKMDFDIFDYENDGKREKTFYTCLKRNAAIKPPANKFKLDEQRSEWLTEIVENNKGLVW
jgi:hypothetical protein